MINVLKPGSGEECKRLGRLVGQRRLDLDNRTWLEPVYEVPQPPVVRKHAEEVESGTVPNKRELRNQAAIAGELTVAGETCSDKGRHSTYKAVEVSVCHRKVCVEAIVTQDRAFSGPAE